MYSFVTLCCLLTAVIPAAVLNIIAYPVSLKWSRKISDYIVKKLAPRVFSILNTYRHFHFFGYDDSKKTASRTVYYNFKPPEPDRHTVLYEFFKGQGIALCRKG